MLPLPELTADERSRYEWQLWVRGFGEEGQRRLKAATVFGSAASAAPSPCNWRRPESVV